MLGRRTRRKRFCRTRFTEGTAGISAVLLKPNVTGGTKIGVVLKRVNLVVLAVRTRLVVEPTFDAVTVDHNVARILVVNNLHAFCLTARASPAGGKCTSSQLDGFL